METTKEELFKLAELFGIPQGQYKKLASRFDGLIPFNPERWDDYIILVFRFGYCPVCDKPLVLRRSYPNGRRREVHTCPEHDVKIGAVKMLLRNTPIDKVAVLLKEVRCPKEGSETPALVTTSGEPG